jgi:hypothetical protein
MGRTFTHPSLSNLFSLSILCIVVDVTDFAHLLRLDGTTPAWTWLVVVGQALLVLGLAALVARRGRTGHVDRATRIENGLLAAGLVFAVVVLGFFMIGTYEGSTAFAADRLDWRDWRKIIPWGSLDAGALTFSLFAIRAVMKGRDPRRSLRIVFALAGLSATLQLTQGGSGHHWQAGLFLGALALLGSLVLHGIADQLQPSDEAIDAHRKSPAFGIRWITDFPGTLCAWLAWHNYPPAADIDRTIAGALENLRRVRAGKLAALLARPTAPRWAVIAPRRYARQLRAAHAEATAAAANLTVELTSVQTARADEHTLYAQNLQALRAELSDATAQAQRAHAAQTALETAAQTIRADLEDQLRTAAQAHRAEGAQAARAEAAQEIDSLRAQLAAARRSASQPTDAKTSAKAKAQEVTHLRDDDEVADAMWDDFCAFMEETGTPLPRYRVQKGAPTNSRQAERVVGILVRRYSEKFGDATAQGAAQAGAHTPAQTGRAESDDQEDSSVKATG